MLIGLYNKCKSYENSLITWGLEAPISTLIKNLIPLRFSTRLTSTAHKLDVQEWSTSQAPPKQLMTPYMNKFKVLNYNHIFWLYRQEPGSLTFRNRDVNSRTVSRLQRKLTRAARALNANTPWSDPEGRFPCSYLLIALLERWCTCPTAQNLPTLSMAPKSLQTRGELMARELAGFLHSPCGIDLSWQRCCRAQVATGASRVQWNVQPLCSALFAHTQLLLQYGLLSYPKSTLP